MGLYTVEEQWVLFAFLKKGQNLFQRPGSVPALQCKQYCARQISGLPKAVSLANHLPPFAIKV